MVILLNIGNTRTHIAEAVDGRIISRRKVLTAELDIRKLPVAVPVAAATVVPELRSRLDGRDIFWLETGCECGLDLSRVDSRTTGAD
ncbi:MAG: hypothetical protein PHV59_04380, partial [Victivallales bacterium]|nr:hypothetical protein [Victivallales bacterium]